MEPRKAATAEELHRVGQAMHERAGLRRQPLGLLVLQLADLPELELVFGRRTAVAAMRLVMKNLAAAAASAGVALQTGAETFALLLPGLRGDELRDAVSARFGAGCCVDVEFDGEEIVLVPDVRAATVPQAGSVEKAYAALLGAIESARRIEDLRCDYLRREREAHSRPMGLQREATGPVHSDVRAANTQHAVAA